MRDIIATVAEGLGWLEADNFVNLPAPFAGFPLYAIGDDGDEDEWRWGNLIIGMAAYAEAAMAKRKILLHHDLSIYRGRLVHCVYAASGDEETELHKYDPENAVGKASAVLAAIQDGLCL